MDFIIDYAAFRYDNRDNNIIMPKHLQYRLHNLLLENLRGENNVG
nr:MAG TPA: Head Tail Connector Protein [Caudoviricetes sp.]